MYMYMYTACVCISRYMYMYIYMYMYMYMYVLLVFKPTWCFVNSLVFIPACSNKLTVMELVK